MIQTIGTVTAEGRRDVILLETQPKERVYFVADADIDADGANGQNGKRAAYMTGDTGSEYLANGGMRWNGSSVVGDSSWGRDIVISNGDRPKVFDGGVIASRTSYSYPGKALSDPAAYVDSETVPYIVVPPLIIEKTKGIVLGCFARATNTRTGKTCHGIVADVGPRNKAGEVSIAMARALGLPSSPRNGGTDLAIVKYELWPGLHGEVDGQRIALRSSKGNYVMPA